MGANGGAGGPGGPPAVWGQMGRPPVAELVEPVAW